MQSIRNYLQTSNQNVPAFLQSITNDFERYISWCEGNTQILTTALQQYQGQTQTSGASTGFSGTGSTSGGQQQSQQEGNKNR